MRIGAERGMGGRISKAVEPGGIKTNVCNIIV